MDNLFTSIVPVIFIAIQLYCGFYSYKVAKRLKLNSILAFMGGFFLFLVGALYYKELDNNDKRSKMVYDLAKEAFEARNQLTPEKIDELVKILRGMIKEYEEALSSNTEWPDEKQTDQESLWHIGEEEKKGKLGWYSKRTKRSLEEKIKKNNYGLPKKLSEDSRKFLEEQVRKHKDTIDYLNGLKEVMIKYPDSWKDKSLLK